MRHAHVAYDGEAYFAELLCPLGIEHKLLAPATIPNYVRNAIKTLLGLQRDRGEKPEFLLLRDGCYRLDIPVDALAGHDDSARVFRIAPASARSIVSRYLTASAPTKIGCSDQCRGNTPF